MTDNLRSKIKNLQSAGTLKVYVPERKNKDKKEKLKMLYRFSGVG